MRTEEMVRLLGFGEFDELSRESTWSLPDHPDRLLQLARRFLHGVILARRTRPTVVDYTRTFRTRHPKTLGQHPELYHIRIHQP